MGIVELNADEKLLNIYGVIICYGDAASEALSTIIAADIETHWNEPKAIVSIEGENVEVRFHISGHFNPALQPVDIYKNDNPALNYFRIEAFSQAHISFVDGLGCNTGYFKLDNLLDHSTTAAHEFGHTLGLPHPANIDIRGETMPGIMYPRGTITDAHFQYDPHAAPSTKGGTLNPAYRKVRQQDIDHLQLNKLVFNKERLAIIGAYSSVWHHKHEQPGDHL